MNRESKEVGQPPANPARFVRVSQTELLGSSKIRNYVFSTLHPTRSTGDFLSRIWALYGSPDSVQFEGFSYAFRDTKTGIRFSAYSAGSGPAFGGFPLDREQLLPVLDDFGAMLDETKPVDCQIEYETDFGRYRSGSRNNKPFDEEVEGS
jgi:hypothetical protein